MSCCWRESTRGSRLFAFSADEAYYAAYADGTYSYCDVAASTVAVGGYATGRYAVKSEKVVVR